MEHLVSQQHFKVQGCWKRDVSPNHLWKEVSTDIFYSFIALSFILPILQGVQGNIWGPETSQQWVSKEG